MKKLADYLDLAKEITGSDYRTAQAMGITRAAISNGRKRGTMDNNQCLALSRILDVNPVEIIAACEVAKNPENEKFWLKWVAAAIIVSGPMMMDLSYKSVAYADSVNGQFIDYALFVVLVMFAAVVKISRPFHDHRTVFQ